MFPADTTKKTFYCIDEIQYLKNPTNFLKYIYDTYSDTIQLIVTGSSSFYLDTKFHDSLIGRKFLFDMYSLSWEEFLHFKQEDELYAKKQNKTLSLIDHRNLEQLRNEYCIYGGYPEVVLLSNHEHKREYLKQYLREYVKKDITDAGVKLQDKYMYILKLLASQIGQLINAHEISNLLGISSSTVQEYLIIMQRSFHIGLVRPFYKNIRKEIIKMPKGYFLDSGIRNVLMNNFENMDIRVDAGHLFENMVYRYFLDQYPSEDIRYRRTKTNQEVDFIIQEQNAYEVKIKSSLYRATKYTSFTQEYPHIPLSCISTESIV
jgi:predicted AAA+ superfamily ATPase